MADKAPSPAYVMPYSNEYIDSLYKRFGKIESSGGKNTNHKILTSGPNAGQTAGGETGIVPGSLQDFIKQSHNHMLAVDPEIEKLSKKSPDEVTEALNYDSDLDRKAFDIAMRRMLQKTGGDEEKIAYGWNRGHNRDFDALTPEKLDKNKYVQDFKKTKSDERYDKIRELSSLLAPKEPSPVPNDFTPDREVATTDEDKLRALKLYRESMN